MFYYLGIFFTLDLSFITLKAGANDSFKGVFFKFIMNVHTAVSLMTLQMYRFGPLGEDPVLATSLL